ncbi:hypothetical protein VIBR0546_08385 [Vibrio brasiliensis LMG 20546]|uniref:Uncharacterized protein n=1 Tax=Vibrio brasiliensis LMG 20546 TaxID=945543 RepID=E8LZT0_9VIBR|nr:hypothetical protein VIBR0546_08385 [Vibrio brasiliensis LMG 20546]
MITLMLFWTFSLILIYVARKLFRYSKNKFYAFCKILAYIVIGSQYYSIFNYGSFVHGNAPSVVNHFEENILNLPNDQIQWSSLVIMFAFAILCIPQYIKKLGKSMLFGLYF